MKTKLDSSLDVGNFHFGIYSDCVVVSKGYGGIVLYIKDIDSLLEELPRARSEMLRLRDLGESIQEGT